MPTDHELMRLHVEALFTHDALGRLLRVNERGGAIAPRFFLGRTRDGSVLRFRNDLDRSLRRELERAAASLPPDPGCADAPIDPRPFESILARAAPVERTWLGPAFSFPEHPASAAGIVRISERDADRLRPLLDAWIADVALCQPMLAFAVDGRAVAVCCTVRRSDRAHEAGVETAPSMRGRGYAAPTVAAWARAVREEGLAPMYSASWENAASLAVARTLALHRFGSDLHIT
jgi:hypothetical protein